MFSLVFRCLDCLFHFCAYVLAVGSSHSSLCRHGEGSGLDWPRGHEQVNRFTRETGLSHSSRFHFGPSPSSRNCKAFTGFRLVSSVRATLHSTQPPTEGRRCDLVPDVPVREASGASREVATDLRSPGRPWCECGRAPPGPAFQGRRAALGGTDTLEPRVGRREVSREVSRHTRRQTPDSSGLSHPPGFELRKEALAIGGRPSQAPVP